MTEEKVILDLIAYCDRRMKEDGIYTGYYAEHKNKLEDDLST